MADDVAAIDAQADIPETVDDQSELTNALDIAKSQVWNKGRDLKLAIQKAVQEAAGALENLLTRLLDLSRLQAGTVRVQRKPLAHAIERVRAPGA